MTSSPPITAHLVSAAVQLRDGGVVGVLVRHEEGSLHRAAVGVDAVRPEDPLVHVHVLAGHRAVEADHDHLGDLRTNQR